MASSNPQSLQGYQIGRAAQRSGVSAANIRFYEKEKLIPPRGVGANSYRIYSEEDVHQLRFIRLLRSLDMSLDEMRALLHLDLRKKTDCQTARDTLDAHLGHVRTRLKELRSLERDLTALRTQCDGQGEQCHLIQALHARANTELPAAGKTLGKNKRHSHV
jgi:DNA-binding transcriptional MerR regulator